MYERFEESVYDIDLWIKEARKLGYKKIILMGHSLGCNKVIHYYTKSKHPLLAGIIFASPPDLLALAKLKRYQPNYEEMIQEAKENLKKNEPRKLLTSLLWKWYLLSSQTFLDLFEEGCSADNLPFLRNPDTWTELGKIDVPVLAFMSGKDDVVIRSLEEDLALIKKKAVHCPKFDTAVLKGANHVYGNKEKELSRMILAWLKRLS
ncbi:MAG: DUF1749 domain-containing protein [Nanoarchaeota archaeon]